MENVQVRTWITEADEYDENLRLSPKSIQVAREELRETASSRNQALEAFRNWIMKNPKIENCRLDSSFLLRFLRVKKMSLPLAQETLLRYLVLRMQTHIWNFRNLDCNLKDLDDFITAGYIFPVPQRDHLGRRIIITNPGKMDPYKHTSADMIQQLGLAFETIMENDEDQVNGVVHFVSGAGFTLPYLTLLTPREVVRLIKNTERTLPMRHKMIIGYEIHPGIKYVLDFVLSLASPKMQSRVKIFSKTEETYSVIDKKLLPKEYGGEIPQDEMIRLWKQELQQRREKLLLNDQLKVNLSLLTEQEKKGAVSSKNASVQTSNPDSADFGISGSFRNLEVD